MRVQIGLIATLLSGVLLASGCGGEQPTTTAKVVTQVVVQVVTQVVSPTSPPSLAAATPTLTPPQVVVNPPEWTATPTPTQAPTPTLTPPKVVVNPPTPTRARTASPTVTPPRLVVNPIYIIQGTPFPTPPGLRINTIDLSSDLLAALTNLRKPDQYTKALAFRVWAYSPKSVLYGAEPKDGDGIKQVEFAIYPAVGGSLGEPIYRRVETLAPFCAFGDDGTDCIPFDLANTGNLWPDKKTPLVAGDYVLKAKITYGNGETRQTDEDFDIVLPPTPTPRPVTLRARIIQPPPGAQAITKQVVFQVEAYDQSVGAKDGAGISSVDMLILDSKNKVVHKRTENTAAYCAFGGGEPDCTIYVFGQYQNRWPDGSPVGDTYTLRAIVRGKSGATLTVQTKVAIKP
jgi:hypothetical protein